MVDKGSAAALGWGWLPVASALVVVGLPAGRMPIGVMDALGRALPAERLLVEHVAPGVPWPPDVPARSGRSARGGATR
ncbi:hypothetical protein [Kitasatospora sp. SUK 42]|uniref:hypothetical protein n=1 Tax=Kitasatospora sp. SUK 42 TaxID=1588882 RepID=UPI0018C8FA52|nr:hypothetical protein [Kitasatospora sp. SUK 42]MBV2153069.1 hypothetical protein [Kitasatospora sp. SUK 42]